MGEGWAGHCWTDFPLKGCCPGRWSGNLKVYWWKNESVWWVKLSKPDSSVGKESLCNAGDLSSIPGLGRSPGEGKGYPLQYSCLENSMDCIVHRVAKSRIWLSDFHFHSIIWPPHAAQWTVKGRYSLVKPIWFQFLVLLPSSSLTVLGETE